MKIKIMLLLGIVTGMFLSCKGQGGQVASRGGSTTSAPQAGAATQVDEYVVTVYEDSKGRLWMGTLGKGAACYDGKKLTYYSQKDGLAGDEVVDFAEDSGGNLWIATHSGLSKYDGRQFTGFTTGDGAAADRISSLLIDKKGNIWVGTWAGVYRVQGDRLVAFALPTPDVALKSYQNTMNWVTEIMEDSKGNTWFCRDGYGACKYDGRSFTHLTQKDGLANNNVQAIAEDGNGNIWFGCRIVERDNPDANARTGEGGVSMYDGTTMKRFAQVKGLTKNDVFAIYKDRQANIWIGANGVGLYRYDGAAFTLYSKTESKEAMTCFLCIQDILQDRHGNLWLGLSGGLFRLMDTTVKNVTTQGPWG